MTILRNGLAVVAIAGALFAACGVQAEETLLERGTYLMRAIVACGNCHTPKGPEGELPGMELAGWAEIESNPAFTASAPNITPDPETGIGGWTDRQIIDAIREGRRPDGSIIGPPMPIALYRGLSDRDAQAIVAYMRQVEPARNAVPKSVYNIPLPPAYGPPVATVPEPDREDRLAYGAYLAGPAGHCIECHSPMGPKGPDWENRLGAGGLEFHLPFGTVVSTNITPAGIGDYSDAEVQRMIREGVRPDGSKMLPPMPYGYYANISDPDMDAIIAFLRSLPER
ncbi:MAG: cytochrome C [Rhizobiales bacterium NRL2]|nr:MAG: cytochrome C [Rhizobiales bacterium NRL2]